MGVPRDHGAGYSQQMDWLSRGWDQAQWIATGVGLCAGVVLVVLGFSGLAELAAAGIAICLRWALWQIPPPGRSRATGTPRDGFSHVGRVAVVVLLVTLTLEIIATPFR